MGTEDQAGEEVSTREAARILGVDEKTVRNRIAAGDLSRLDTGRLSLSEVMAQKNSSGLPELQAMMTAQTAAFVECQKTMAKMVELVPRAVEVAISSVRTENVRLTAQNELLFSERIDIMKTLGELLEKKAERDAHASVAEHRRAQISKVASQLIEFAPTLLTQAAGARKFAELVKSLDAATVEGFREMLPHLENKTLAKTLGAMLDELPAAKDLPLLPADQAAVDAQAATAEPAVEPAAP